jgi:hypothetical protein
VSGQVVSALAIGVAECGHALHEHLTTYPEVLAYFLKKHPGPSGCQTLKVGASQHQTASCNLRIHGGHRSRTLSEPPASGEKDGWMTDTALFVDTSSNVQQNHGLCVGVGLCAGARACGCFGARLRHGQAAHLNATARIAKYPGKPNRSTSICSRSAALRKTSGRPRGASAGNDALASPVEEAANASAPSRSTPSGGHAEILAPWRLTR